MPTNATHDAVLRSWVTSANLEPTRGFWGEQAAFPVQNLPYGVFRMGAAAHVGVAIGDRILDLHTLLASGVWSDLPEALRAACRASRLNDLMAVGNDLQGRLRLRLSEWLRVSADDAGHVATLRPHLRPQADTEMLLPAAIGDYTDFYASHYHATAVGSLFRPANPLLPNYKYVPVGYHGRSSSVVVSGTAVRRPVGQLPGARSATASAGEEPPPVFGASRQLDYELELGAFIGNGNELGCPVPLRAADKRLFGVVLLNDWSARDIQRWEYQPLGPFLGKNFATSISPWVVTTAALAPFRAPLAARAVADPSPLPYLDDAHDRTDGALDVIVEVYLASAAMRERDLDPLPVGRANARHLYWTLGQMLAHHTSNGCNLRSGDLFGTGTISGPGVEERGCLLEKTRGGADPITLPSGETRRFLEDGDEVTLRGFCERPGWRRIGLGDCSGIVRAPEAPCP